MAQIWFNEYSENSKENFRVMKTENNLKKTVNWKMTALTVVVIFSLAFLSTFGKETESLKQVPAASFVHSTFGFTIIQKIDSKTISCGSEITTAKNESAQIINLEKFQVNNETDAKLKIEDWMINSKNFSSAIPALETGNDKPLILEKWMTNNHFWGF